MSRILPRVVLVIAAAASLALGQQSTGSKSAAAAKFIGTWKLISIADHRPNVVNPARDPQGYIVYDSTGHIFVQFALRKDRPRFASEDLTKANVQEKAAALDGYTAYFGTYTVNEAAGTVTHHLENHLIPNNAGKDYIRYYEISGDRLTLIPITLEKGQLAPKSSGLRRLTWERVK